MVLKIVLGLLVLALPFLIGGIFRSKSIPFTYLIGQIMMWAAFQLVAVPAIHLRTSFTLLFWAYSGLVLILAVLGLIRRKKIKFDKPQLSLFLGLAFMVILYQCSVYIFGQHLDEDDARWIAEANDALVKDKMLLFNPATGEYIGRFVGEMVKDAFSPWAFYIAWMSRLTGIKAVVIAHTVYPPVLLSLSYMCYWEIGMQLFKGKAERGIFLLMVAVINLFLAGNSYTQSVFTLTRIWQGKAVVAAVMIPAVLAVILRVQSEDKVGNWLQLVLVGITCCLFSGMGIAIGVLMIAVYGLYALVRSIIVNWRTGLKRIPLWLLSISPSVVFGWGYFLLK